MLRPRKDNNAGAFSRIAPEIALGNSANWLPFFAIFGQIDYDRDTENQENILVWG